MIDSRLFIDMQYQEEFNGYCNGFRIRFIEDSYGRYVAPGSITICEMNDAQFARRQRAISHHRTYHAGLEQHRMDIRRRLKHQLYGTVPQWRLANVPRYELANTLQCLSDFACGIRDEDADVILETLNELRHIASGLARRLCNTYCDDYEIAQCNDCNEFVFRDDASYANDDYLVCDACRDDAYTYSECMSTLISWDDAYPVYDSFHAWENESADDRCTARYGDRHLYEFDGAYFSDENDMCLARGDEDEDEGEESSSYDSDRLYYTPPTPTPEQLERQRIDAEERVVLPQYHNAARNFIERNSGKYPALGAELEVYAPKRLEFIYALRDKFGTEGNQLLWERDGSLDHFCGIELITQPYGRTEWNGLCKDLFPLLHEHSAIGFNDPAGANYGIHITMHRRHLSPLAEARISMFLSARENANFVRAIAQRFQLYSASNGIGMDALLSPKVRNISQGNMIVHHRDYVYSEYSESARTQKKISGRGKYCPVNWKPNYAEFRIFQSTTNVESFVKNLEFVWALHAWTKPESATGNSYHHVDFLRWLNLPANRYDFPTLTDFLSKKVFHGTNYEPIESTWQQLMLRPVEEYAAEPMAA